MDIQHQEQDSKGSFFIETEGKHVAEMTYSVAGTTRIIIDHTEIDDSLRGQKVGNQLVMAAVTYARENQKIILPLCPFARSVFQKTPEIRDVLS